MANVWIKDLDRLIYQTEANAQILYYQLALLEPFASSGLMIPICLSAYQPELLVYSLERKTKYESLKNKHSLSVLISILEQYCKLRSQMHDQLLEYKRIILDEEYIYLSTDENNHGEVYFLYLPVTTEQDEGVLEEKQLESLSSFVEKAILAAAHTDLLSETEIAAWIQSSYSDFERFKEISLQLSCKVKSSNDTTAALRPDHSLGLKRKIENRFKPKADDRMHFSFAKEAASAEPYYAPRKNKGIKKIRDGGRTQKRSNKMGFSIVFVILLALVFGNLILQLDISGDPFWQLPLAAFFLLIAVSTTLIALLHPKSPFHQKASRFQSEHESALAQLLNKSAEQSAENKRSLNNEGRRLRTTAYLMPVPSTQGNRLRSKDEIQEAEVEVFIFEQAIKFGSSTQLADYSFAFKDEAELHSCIYCDEAAAHLEVLDTETQIFINDVLCEGTGPHLLPDHCLLKIGPVLREFYKEKIY